MTEPTHVLVVEDHPSVGRAWRNTLVRAGHAVDVADCLADARRLLDEADDRKQPYQAVVLDLVLPDGDGADLLEDLQQRRPRPGVAVVSAHLDSKRVLELWGRTLIDVPKPVSTETMVALVARLASTDPSMGAVARFCEACQLGPRETRIVEHAARGSSLEDIAVDLGCAVSTLKTFWKRIHDKTGLRTRREVISAAWQGRPKR